MRGGIGGGSGEGGGGLGRCTQARAGSYRLVQAVLTEAEVSTSCGVRGVAEDVDAATGGIFTPPCCSPIFSGRTQDTGTGGPAARTPHTSTIKYN